MSRAEITVSVDIDDVLEQATTEDLRSALEARDDGSSAEQLDAIKDCFAAVARGDLSLASALLNRVFSDGAQIAAAERGIQACAAKRAA